MAKADLGTKRMCSKCGMRFYDFSRSPIVCPGCGAEFDAQNITKSRKGRSAAKTTPRDDVNATADNHIEGDDDASDLTNTVVNDNDKDIDNDDDDICFDDDDDDEDVDVDEDGPGIIQDDMGDDDQLLPNLDDKDEN